MNCIFCDIVNNKIKSDIVYSDEKVLCFLPKEMQVYGHMLVIPKAHYENIFDIPEDELEHIMKVVKELSIHLQKAIGATCINLLHASVEDAQQSVNHFHIHLFPRFKDDGINAWPKLDKIDDDKKKELLEKIRC
jgi:histidine triad (HIT) family protein